MVRWVIISVPHGAMGHHISPSWCDGSSYQSLIVRWVIISVPHGAMGHHISPSWCDGSSYQSLMVDLLSHFLFQPVLYNWCNNSCGMWFPVCGMAHIKEPLLLIKNSSPCSGESMFPLSLSEWFYTICSMPYNRK